MSNDEKDLSYPYMQKQEGVCQVNMFGGEKITKPIYCIDCELPQQAVTNDDEMNPIQAYEHLQIHKESGHLVYRHGEDALANNANRWHKLMVKKASKDKEEAEKASMKKALHG